MFQPYLGFEVAEAEQIVGQWRTLHDPSAKFGSPCHISVLFPFVPVEMWNEAIDSRVAAVVEKHAPFEFDLVDVDEFPGVIWLRPGPDEPFRELRTALWAEFPSYSPFGGEFPDSPPHLTVAFVETAEQADLVAAVRRDIGEHLPVHCRAERVALFGYDDSGRCFRHRDFRLGGA